MKILHLMRHAKSAWDSAAELADHERALTPRGMRAATQMGRYFKRHGLGFDLVLCSTARRAVDTLDLLLDELDALSCPVERERGLYLCGAHVLLERLRDLPDSVSRVLLVAHNPDIQEVAAMLVDESAETHNATLFTALLRKFPTSACATLEFAVPSWSAVAPVSARLVGFAQPRHLQSE